MEASSLFEPIEASFRVTNPNKNNQSIYVNVVGVTEGWAVEGEGIGVLQEFDGYEEKTFDITITPGSSVAFTDAVEAEFVAGCAEWYGEDFGGHLKPFGGVTISAKTYYRSALSLNADLLDNYGIRLRGQLNYLDDVPEYLRPSDEGDRTVYLSIRDLNQGIEK